MKIKSIMIKGVGHRHIVLTNPKELWSYFLKDRYLLKVMADAGAELITVCMDMILVDVTHIPDVKVDDEVVLFGRQDGAQISVDEIASKTGTINY